MTQHPEGTSALAAPTLAEDLLLLLFQPKSGVFAGENTLFYVLAGAVLTDLALADQVTATPTMIGGTRVAAVAERPPSDEHLRTAWDYVADKPRGVQTVLAAIGPKLRAPLLERLVQRGDLRQEERKALGLIKTTAFHEGDPGRRAGLLADVRATLVEGGEPEPRVAALAGLLSGSGTLPQFDPEIPWTSPVIARAKEFEQGNWGAGAAAKAVARTVAATIVGSVSVAAAVLPRT